MTISPDRSWANSAGPATPATAEAGQRVAELMGCVACHSGDGSTIGKVVLEGFA